MKRWLSMMMVGAWLIILSACGGGEQSGGQPGASQSNLKVYHHFDDGAPITMDPVQAADIYADLMVRNLYDTLYRYKYLARPYQLTTNLATAMPEVSADGLTYTIHIKQGVHFIDDAAFPGGKGREVTAQDFVYSIERQFDPKTRPQGTWLWLGYIEGLDQWKKDGSDYSKPVSGLKALDSYTIQIKLVKPYPQLTETLAMGFSAIVPREAVEKYGREFGIHPVGSGPFILDSFNTAQAVMHANPDFRKEPVSLATEGYDPKTQGGYGLETIDGRSPPFVDKVIISFIKEQSARWTSFTKGDEIQYTIVPKDQLEQLVSNKHPVTLKPEYAKQWNYFAAEEAGFTYYGFNMDDPSIGYNDNPQRNKANHALRCAIRKAFNWENYNRAFYNDIGDVYPGVIPPMVQAYDPDLSKDSITYDPDGARKLLADNGWTADNLPKIEWANVASVTSNQQFEQFRGFLQKIGYPRDKITRKDLATFGDFNQALKQSRLQFFGLGWGLDYPDAQNTLQLFYGPNHSPGSNNFNYENPKFDKLFEQAATMQPGPERDTIYHKLNQMVIDDCVVISALSRNRVYVWQKNVIELPDRQIEGGYFLRFVDIKQDKNKN